MCHCVCAERCIVVFALRTARPAPAARSFARYVEEGVVSSEDCLNPEDCLERRDAASEFSLTVPSDERSLFVVSARGLAAVSHANRARGRAYALHTPRTPRTRVFPFPRTPCRRALQLVINRNSLLNLGLELDYSVDAVALPARPRGLAVALSAQGVRTALEVRLRRLPRGAARAWTSALRTRGMAAQDIAKPMLFDTFLCPAAVRASPAAIPAECAVRCLGAGQARSGGRQAA